MQLTGHPDQPLCPAPPLLVLVDIARLPSLCMRNRVEGRAIEQAVTLEVSPSYLSPAPRISLNGSLTDCHDVLASAVLPQSTPTLVELGVAAAVVAFTAGLINRVAPAGRGPQCWSPPSPVKPS